MAQRQWQNLTSAGNYPPFTLRGGKYVLSATGGQMNGATVEVQFSLDNGVTFNSFPPNGQDTSATGLLKLTALNSPSTPYDTGVVGSSLIAQLVVTGSPNIGSVTLTSV